MLSCKNITAILFRRKKKYKVTNTIIYIKITITCNCIWFFSGFMLTLSRILTYFNWDCIRTKGLMIRQLTNQRRENEMNFQSFFTHNKHLMYLAETILQNLTSLANILKWNIILSKNEIRVDNYSLIYCIGSCYVCFKWDCKENYIY